jgi:TolA-binding protein
MTARSRLATKLQNTGELYLSLRLPGPARVYFARVRDEYGDTLLLPQTLLGLAMCDALEGHRADAIAQLKHIESGYPGSSAAERAARERARLERQRGS